MGEHESNDWFHTTHWSIVRAARDTDDSRAEDALSELCQTYWRPLYTFLRRSGNSPHDAQDLTQSFFATLIDKDYLKSVDQQKGRFRSFLLVAIKHFVANQRKHDQAIKRGGAYQRLSLDYADAERLLERAPSSHGSPDQEFEYNWAITVLDRAFESVRADFEASGKSVDFEQLKPFLVPNDNLPSFKQVGQLLGLGESGARSAVHRLRRRYRKALRDQVAQTVDSQEDIDDELQQLMASLARQ